MTEKADYTSSMMQLRDHYRPRVIAGYMWLEENFPELLEHLTVEDLDLGDSCNCILGQLGHIVPSDTALEKGGAWSFNELVREPWEANVEPSELRDVRYEKLIMDRQQARDLGFDRDELSPVTNAYYGDARRIEYVLLTELWGLMLEGRDV